MPNSINTNYGAMIALQNLNRTVDDLGMTQNRISTGRKINNAKDNGGIWAIAQNQRATSNSLNAVKESLQRGQSTVDVAMAAGESISDMLVTMKEKALASSDTSTDATSRAALNNDYIFLRDQITKVVANASFNGVNMIQAAGTTIQALADANGTNKMTVLTQDLSLTGVGLTATSSIGTQALGVSQLALVNTAITGVSTKLAALGSGSKALGNHLTFIGKLQDAIDGGVGNLVDADLAKESAKLTALQTKQQLGFQALSIANSSSQSFLSLFR
jgi:flagellin